MTNVTVEKVFGGYIVQVRVETKDENMKEVLREAARAVNVEVIKNERTDSGRYSSW